MTPAEQESRADSVADTSARVAVIGAGVAGLSCAYELTKSGLACDVYERWPGLGGQAATLDMGDGIRVERYYHYLFTSDTAIIGLFAELGLGGDLERHVASTAIATEGLIWPFNGGLDLLRFRPAPPWTRLRMAAALFRMQFSGDLGTYERITARAWIERHMGQSAWDQLWGPLMRGKFGVRAEDVSMAWIWDKVNRRRNVRSGEAREEAFLYPRRSFEPFFVGLADRIEAQGGHVMIDRPAAQITRHGNRLAVVPGVAGSFRLGLDPRHFKTDGPAIEYGAVVCCVPNDVFCRLLDPRLESEIDARYREQLESIEYMAAFNLLLELKRPLTEHFWVNVADRRCPFVGLIEHTNLVGRDITGGRVFSHVTNYLASDDPLLDLELDELLGRYAEGLRILAPKFRSSEIVNAWLFREPAGQPVVDVGFSERIPSRRTPATGLYLVNTTQIYPQDRGTNYAVRDGVAAARDVMSELAVHG